MADIDAFYEGEYTIFFISSWDIVNSEKIWNDVKNSFDGLCVVIHVPLLCETCKFYDQNTSYRPNLKCIDDKRVATRVMNRFNVFQLPCSVVVNSMSKIQSITYINMPSQDLSDGEVICEEALFRQAINAFNNFDLHEAAAKCVIY